MVSINSEPLPKFEAFFGLDMDLEYTCVATFRGGEAELIPFNKQGFLIPSIVYCESENSFKFGLDA